MLSTLTEIKKGHTGTGLLIENDGYAFIKDPMNNKLNEALEPDDDGNIHIPYPFVVSAVFQKYGIENANGRIYPEDILKREVEKYQQAIKERRAYGECYKPETPILTKNGWKMLMDVHEGDEVLTLNPYTKDIEIKPIIKKISYHYNGDMVRINGNLIDDTVTPNHKFPVFNRNGNFDRFYTAEEIYEDNNRKLSHSYLLKNGNWNEKGQDMFVLKGINNPNRQTIMNHPDCKNDISIPMSTFMKFMGIYLSEGDYGKKSNAVRVYQLKEDNCKLIEELYNEMGFPYHIVNKGEGKCKAFVIYDPRLHDYVKQFGNCYTKYIPSELKNQSKENLRLLYDWFVLGDGRIRGDRRVKSNKTDDVFSSSKRLIMDLNEIQLKIGYNGSFHIEKRDNDRYIQGRLIEGKNCHPMYFTFRSLSKGVYLDKRFLKVSKEYYDGEVQCIEVENHTWYVMSDNGKCHWTGNCNHPSSSSIDVGRIAMNIIELHWEGHTLVGQMEIPISYGFRKYGIVSTCADQVAQWIISGLKIGVSSRALGSVTQQGNALIVGDDLELVCWDVVSQPSTPGAWIEPSEEKLHQYIESEKKKGSLIAETENNKFDKFKDWLKD